MRTEKCIRDVIAYTPNTHTEMPLLEISNQDNPKVPSSRQSQKLYRDAPPHPSRQYLACPVQMAHPLAIAVDPSDAIGHVRHKLAVAHVRERQLVARRNVGHKGLSKGAQDICEFLRVSINTQGIYKLPRPKLRSYKYLEHLAVHEVELDVHALHVKEATKWSAARAMHEP